MELEENPEFNENPWENDDYGSLKMSMADLKHFITKSMVETSKLDACFDIFLVEVSDIRGVALHEVLNFSAYRGKNAGKLRKAAGTLRKNIDCLLPGFLNLPPGSNILEDEKLKQRLHDRVYRLASGNRYLNNSEFGKQSYYASYILPVLRQKREELMEDSAVEDMLKFLRDGEEFEPYFAQIPQILPLEPDLEEYWKMLYVSRRLYGTGKIIQFAIEKELEMDPRIFQDKEGNHFGTELHQYLLDSDLFEEDETISGAVNRLWPAQFIPGITWISEPSNKEMAFSHLAQGNEPSINTFYSCATILAAVPPFDQRQPTRDRDAAKI